jgi:hypothetical protein
MVCSGMGVSGRAARVGAAAKLQTPDIESDGVAAKAISATKIVFSYS